jgi:hypothetical protein
MIQMYDGERALEGGRRRSWDELLRAFGGAGAAPVDRR